MVIRWIEKTGSNITAIGHSLDNVLYVKFNSGKVYSYKPFSLKEFNTFNAAPSVGSYFHKKIRVNKKLKYKVEDEII